MRVRRTRRACREASSNLCETRRRRCSQCTLSVCRDQPSYTGKYPREEPLVPKRTFPTHHTHTQVRSRVSLTPTACGCMVVWRRIGGCAGDGAPTEWGSRGGPGRGAVPQTNRVLAHPSSKGV